MRTFRRLLGFLGPYRGEVIITAVLAAGTQAAGLLIPYLTGKVIDAAQAGDSRSQIYTAGNSDTWARGSSTSCWICWPRRCRPRGSSVTSDAAPALERVRR